ncbi:MAG TPA: hypothetical protein VFR08_05650 [Candidatus Angelobacter sp.]|nr:hypothetical protein [Candidatus Angelobacter sp.]
MTKMLKKLKILVFCAVFLFATRSQTLFAQDDIDKDAVKTPASPATHKNKAPKQPASVDPWVGSWKMDAGQSKPHGPAPKEETLVIDSVTGDHIKYSIHSVGETGQYTITYEGKPGTPSPILVDGKESGSAVYHRVTPRKYTGKGAMASGLKTSETITLSPDSRKTTVKVHGKDARGEFDEVMVYTR